MTTKTKRITVLLAGFWLPMLLLIGAIAPSLAYAQDETIAQGYATEDTSLTEGLAVSLAANSTQERQVVERTNQSNQNMFVGIITTISANSTPGTSVGAVVYVATIGEVNGFVSDINGTVKGGDYVVASPLDGVLMKANPGKQEVMGVAKNDSSAQNAQTRSVTNSNGGQQDTLINKVTLSISPGTISNTEGASFLVLFGKSLTGKSVSAVQVLAGMAIFFFLIVVEGAIIYAAVRNSIVAIGRNPLASPSLYRQLFQVSWLAVLVLLFGIAAIYVTLWA